VRRLFILAVVVGLISWACAILPGGSSSAPSDSVVVTLEVAGSEMYRIRMTDPSDIAIARDLLAGNPAPAIPNGLVVRDGDGGVNTGYGWHIDPADIEWADITTEVCDGLPSDVEQGTITSDRFCPWSAVVVAVDPI
jgi:hypothetical protein